MGFRTSADHFPPACASSKSLMEKECCPPWTRREPCGRLSGRGSCRVILSTAPLGPQFPFTGWTTASLGPSIFYNRTCQCFGNFMGFNCGSCKFGFGDPAAQATAGWGRSIFDLGVPGRTNFLPISLWQNIPPAQTTSSPRAPMAKWITEQRPCLMTSAFMTSLSGCIIMCQGTRCLGTLKSGETLILLMKPQVSCLGIDSFCCCGNRKSKLTGDENFTIPYWDWRDAENCEVAQMSTWEVATLQTLICSAQHPSSPLE